MPDEPSGPDGYYEVGYGKPPKHTQFVPGQSGFKGRKRKPTQDLRKILAKVRDEEVTVAGEKISMITLAIKQVFTQTIKSGKARDLSILFSLLEKYGAMPQVDEGAQLKATAESVINKIMTTFDRTYDIDPEDSAASQRDDDADAMLVISCPHCGPVLKERWKDDDYVARTRRYGRSRLHNQVIGARERQNSKSKP